MINLSIWQFILTLAYCGLGFGTIGFFIGEWMQRRLHNRFQQYMNDELQAAQQAVQQYQMAEQMLRQVAWGEQPVEVPKTFWN